MVLAASGEVSPYAVFHSGWKAFSDALGLGGAHVKQNSNRIYYFQGKTGSDEHHHWLNGSNAFDSHYWNAITKNLLFGGILCARPRSLVKRNHL